jgi:hypothetical protein
MADSRQTFAQWLAALDNVAKLIQIAKSTFGDAFQTTTSEPTGTLRETLRYLVETRLRAYTSDSALRFITPPAEGALRTFESASISIDALNRYLYPIVAAINNHHVQFGSDLVPTTDVDDTRYSAASSAFAALWAWASGGNSVAANKRVLGEVIDVMAAGGMRWDPAYAAPPEHLELARITFSGAAAATFTTTNEIDPLKYTGHDTELYVIARGTPNAGTISLVGKDESDTATDAAGTTFTASVATEAAGDVIAVAQTDSHVLHSTKGGTLTVTGGENGLILALRVKQFRAAAK